MLNTAILLVTTVSAIGLFHPRLTRNTQWRAIITPLASIIGSGFLVLGPILDASYGYLAPLVMAGLCVVSYVFGAAIRHNIARIDRTGDSRTALETRLETVASWVLAFAYVISVAYYLNLFGAFGVSLTALSDDLHARMLTTGAFSLILVMGWTRGFAALEAMEQVAVSLKLAIIVGLLFGLAWFFTGRVATGALVVNPPEVSGWAGLALAFGLIVTVQGFETSRYLGEDYDAPTRIKSMRRAQWISAAIYMIYILLIAYVFERGSLHLEETAIISLMQIVAPILPLLLVVAALAAQFSAATADTAGSGGLLAELTRGRLSPRAGYLVLVGIGVLMTWTLDIFQIISYASRAFALYYAVQCAIAGVGAWQQSGARARAWLYFAAGLLAVAITLTGTPVEA